MVKNIKDDVELSNIEINLVIDAIKSCYGVDFSHYKKASLKRRLKNVVEKSKLDHISELIPAIIYTPEFFGFLINEVTVPVTEMFRDPFFFQVFRNEIVPILKTYPFIKIWDAGCADGKMAYSLAIILHEEGLYDRCKIIGTDINTIALAKAKEGIYNANEILDFTDNYEKMGGKHSLKDYFNFTFENAIIHNHLKYRVQFLNHNLTDLQSIGTMNIVLCQNVFIYFEKELQEKLLKFFLESLQSKGFLCLGPKESIRYSQYENEFIQLNEHAHIYRKLYQ